MNKKADKTELSSITGDEGQKKKNEWSLKKSQRGKSLMRRVAGELGGTRTHTAHTQHTHPPAPLQRRTERERERVNNP